MTHSVVRFPSAGVAIGRGESLSRCPSLRHIYPVLRSSAAVAEFRGGGRGICPSASAIGHVASHLGMSPSRTSLHRPFIVLSLGVGPAPGRFGRGDLRPPAGGYHIFPGAAETSFDCAVAHEKDLTFLVGWSVSRGRPPADPRRGEATWRK